MLLIRKMKSIYNYTLCFFSPFPSLVFSKQKNLSFLDPQNEADFLEAKKVIPIFATGKMITYKQVTDYLLLNLQIGIISFYHMVKTTLPCSVV